MSPIKVTVYKGKEAIEKFYFGFDSSQYELITAFESALRTRINHKDFSLSWIDSDADEISIKDDDDFEFFRREVRGRSLSHSSAPMKLNVHLETISAAPEPEKRVSFSIATDTKASAPQESLFQHTSVVCDGCDGEVRGFRYKCLQCADYDLCMTCEAKMLHKDHLMVRIPGNPATLLPCKLDRVLNIGKYMTAPREEPKKERKEPKDWRKEEKCWRKEEDKMRKVEEKMRRFEEKLCRREDKQERRRHHRAATAPTSRSAEATPTATNPHGFFYQALDFLNFMMNPDNIMASHFTPPPTAPPASQEPTKEATPEQPVPSTDKAQEAQEKTKPAATDKAQEAQEKSEEPGRSFLQPTIATAVALGTDANSMTTSVGVPAAEESDNTKCLVPEKKNEEAETIQQQQPKVAPRTEYQQFDPTPVKSIEQQLKEKLEAMEKQFERSHSPTISIVSTDSDSSKDGDRDWTVIDDEEENAGAVGGQPQEKQDKATSTDSEASSIKDQPGNSTPPKKSLEPSIPMSFEQLGRDLKAHIEAESKPQQVQIPPPERIPHHPIPHIHHAVETMIGMGFSNEGGWLSNLLASVNGNIPKALDLLQPHK